MGSSKSAPGYGCAGRACAPRVRENVRSKQSLAAILAVVIGHRREVSLSSSAQAPGDPLGLHRVIEPHGVLPQAATRLDARREIWPDEVRIDVERLNLDAASFRQLSDKHDGDGAAVRAEVLAIIASRGKMQNPVTGSGGMLIGTVAEVGPESPLGLAVGDRVATLVSLTLTPLVITDGLGRLGRHERAGTVPPATRSCSAARSPPSCPDDLPAHLSLAVMDVCGAPALTARVVAQYVDRGRPPSCASSAGPARAARCPWPQPAEAGARRTVGVVPVQREAELLADKGLADAVALADARDPVALAARHRRGRRPGRRHGGLRRRTGLRARRDPGHRRTAAPSSSSRWPHRSRRPPSAPRGWPPTSRCWSATATCPGTPPTRSTCCAATPASAACSRRGRARDGRIGACAHCLGPASRRDVHSPAHPAATALLTVGDRVAWVGDDDTPARIETAPTSPSTWPVALVTPGFVDAHVHATKTGLALGASTWPTR